MFLTETWLVTDGPASLLETSPPNYNFSYSSRTAKKGGSTATILSASLASPHLANTCKLVISTCTWTISQTLLLLNLLNYVNFTQLVTQPSHNSGHTLDLVITHGLSANISSVMDVGISDHFCVFLTVNGFIQQDIPE